MKRLIQGLIGASVLATLFALWAIAQPVTNPAPVALACAYNSAVPTGTSGQFAYVQCDASGNLKVNGSVTPTGGTASNSISSIFGRTLFIDDFGAKGDGATDDTAAINAAVAYVLANSGSLSCRNAVYKVTSTITIDVGLSTHNLQSDGFKFLANGGCDLDGTTITNGPTLKFLCTGSAHCDNLVIRNRWTIKGSNAGGYVVQIGNTSLADSFNIADIDYIIAQNFSSTAGSGGIQINKVSDSHLRLLAYMPNNPASGVGIALENATRNVIEIQSNPGSNGTALLIENSTTTGNNITAFDGTAASTCIRITAAGATNNTFLSPYFGGCVTGASGTAGANNVLYNPNCIGPTACVPNNTVGIVIDPANNSFTVDNRIFNPCFAIDQRNEGATFTTGYGPDRWTYNPANTNRLNLARLQQQFGKCAFALRATVNVAGTPAAGDFYGLNQSIEANFVTDLQFGTATAQPLILDFCAQTSIVGGGTFGWALINTNASFSYVSTYTLAAANTKTCYSINIPGDTVNFLNTPPSTGRAFRLVFDYGSGSNNTTSTLNTWTAGVFFGASTETVFINQTAASTLDISQVRLYPGVSDLSWTPRSYAEEIRLARRYYRKTFASGTVPAQNAGVLNALCVENPIALASPHVVWQYGEEMRIAPTITTYNPSATNANWRDVTASSDITVNVDPAAAKSLDRLEIATTGTVSTLADTLCIHAAANADF
jgi:hypothetical protein